MANRARREQAKQPPPEPRWTFGRVARAVGLMLLLGLLVGWASSRLAMGLGLSRENARQISWGGILLGLAWGWGTMVNRTLSKLMRYTGLILVTGAVFWFFGVLLGGVAVACGASEEVADTIPIVATVLGLALVAFPLAVMGAEWAQKVRYWLSDRQA